MLQAGKEYLVEFSSRRLASRWIPEDDMKKDYPEHIPTPEDHDQVDNDDAGSAVGHLCCAFWCSRRGGSMVRVPRVTKKTASAKVTDLASQRQHTLRRLFREDINAEERTGTRVQGDLRYCTLHATDDGNGIRDVLDDPVFRGDVDGLRLAAVMESTTLRQKHKDLLAQQSAPTSASKRARKRKQDAVVEEALRIAGSNEAKSPTEQVVALAEKVVDMAENAERVAERIKQLEEREGSDAPQWLSYDSLVNGDTIRCETFAVIGAERLKGLVAGMKATGKEVAWRSILADRPGLRDKIGFETAVALVFVKCGTGDPFEIVGWMFGLGKQSAQYASLLFRPTLVGINLFFEEAVARVPDLEYLDKYAHSTMLNPDFDNVVLILDASNCPHDKPHTPHGEKHSWSEYYGQNCAKFDIGVGPDLMPLFCSFMFGGRASEEQIIVQSNFESWFAKLKQICIVTVVDHTSKPPGMSACLTRVCMPRRRCRLNSSLGRVSRVFAYSCL